MSPAVIVFHVFSSFPVYLKVIWTSVLSQLIQTQPPQVKIAFSAIQGVNNFLYTSDDELFLPMKTKG